VAGALEGIVVLDLTRVLAGPYCTLVLADLGARVIKVEHPDGGDDARRIGPFLEPQAGGEPTSAYFASLNRGKESIALDLKRAEDRSVFDALLETADVLVENYRPGTLERLGYRWEALHARHPRLVVASTSGFGASGPYARRPAYDVIVQAMGGIMSLTGHPGAPPTRVGTSIGDIAAGLFTAVGICAALRDRERSGQGRRIDVSMLDCQVAILENAIARYEATGEVPGPLGSRHPSITPFAAFATADGFLVIAAGNDRLFRALCGVLGRPDLADRDDFASNELRTRNEAALRREIESALAGAPSAAWLARLEAAGVPCGPIQDVAQVCQDPQVLARNMVVRVDDAALGQLRVAGNPIKMSGFADPTTRAPAPALDADGARIRAELRRKRD
jgi:CoA:oxalate CoA-transferase